eukprot:7788706-Ditylum_brightwellii.AAC.1
MENENNYFHISRPNSGFVTRYYIGGYLAPCLVLGYTYTIKLRYRSYSEESETLKLRWGWKKDDVWNRWSNRFECPSAGESAGWVDCSYSFLVTEDMAGATLYEFFTYTDLDRDVYMRPRIDLDDISITRDTLTDNMIYLSADAVRCWNAGDELAITSDTYNEDDYQVVTVKEIDLTSCAIILTASLITVPSSIESDPEFPVHVANLNRKIIFEGKEDESNSLLGGHLIILKTPIVAQYIEGVEFRNFGQQNNLGRY